MGESIQCWQCGTRMTLDELASNDGDCPRCEVEVHLAEYLDNALSRVAELEADLTKLHAELERRAVDGWIPVSERLPQIKQVLSEKCTLEGREIPTLYRSGFVLTFDGKQVSAGIVEWFHGKTPLSGVTHWMSLPAAPGAAPSAPKADDPVKQMLLDALESAVLECIQRIKAAKRSKPADWERGYNSAITVLELFAKEVKGKQWAGTEGAVVNQKITTDAAIAAARKEGGKV